VSNNAVAGVVLNYLEENPGELERLRLLVLACVAGSGSVADRATMPGHVTCSAVAVTADWRVLHVHHRRLARWLLPGGHVETADQSLLGTALRHCARESGIAADAVIPDTARPVDIDAQVVAADPTRNEPSHIHYDVRFILHVPDGVVRLCSQDLSDHRWIFLREIPGTLGDKLRIRSVHAGWARLPHGRTH
jgi:8-oxo-dGTP pyrophosphatase MutT (NUDIX family)